MTSPYGYVALATTASTSAAESTTGMYRLRRAREQL